MEWLNQIWLFRDVIRPLLDILILSFIIYQIYQILVQTRAIQLVKGAFLMTLIYVLAFFLELSTLLWIMNGLATVLVIIIAIVFQPELRNIFTTIGRGEWLRLQNRGTSYQLDSVLNAVEVLSGRQRGALIVFSLKVGLKNIIETGTRLNADISSSLILTIFGHDTPLHDGAIVLQGGEIVSAGCFLPLSEQSDIRRSFGTRHRAALGLAEETDAAVLIVSEETGAISLAYNANLYYDLTVQEVRLTLRRLLNIHEDEREEEAAAIES
ncbi:TIGR00159 family protein [Marispirochaeta aestuarii]|uniref:Diadenylate cyclase n=1 Tax=Marispirochaeta aestuarii TaxID=1963862 RepID=A0A1Y1RV76_9SPIO|nr:diadenylate cyclase CdaA [Marispirochaeta aestuarii]ORC33885.1 TIGR00159 family protein [Marispirochaeta aestuarii]